MNEINQRLAAIQARADAATPGPWVVNDACPHFVDRPDGSAVAHADRTNRQNTAAFIASSRTEIPRLVAALREAVAALDRCPCDHAETLERVEAALRGEK